MNNEIRELNTEEVTSVAGGFDMIDWCGTRPRPLPPRPWVFFKPVNPIVFGPGGG